ncbi:hypothetical protein L7F22_017447 [Adiantum nelumboides]|nr:hypothetical protein [Adiantum nelumboides]
MTADEKPKAGVIGGYLTPEEQKAYMAEQRCFGCHVKGHRKQDCAKWKERQQASTSAVAASPASKTPASSGTPSVEHLVPSLRQPQVVLDDKQEGVPTRLGLLRAYGSAKGHNFTILFDTEFGCGLCKKVLKLPLSTPCGHNFCKPCLDTAFSGQKDVRERVGVGGRSLRAQKVVKRCPTCQADISELLQNPQVNRQMEDVIQSLKRSSQDSDEDSAEDEKDEKNVNDAGLAEKEMSNSHVEDSNEQLEDRNGYLKLPHGAQSSNGGHKLKLDSLKEEQFLKVFVRFPEYSEDLLRSMLADQDGDLGELEGMLRILQKEERKRSRKELQDTKKRGDDTGSTREDDEENEAREEDGEKGRPRKKRKKDELEEA